MKGITIRIDESKVFGAMFVLGMMYAPKKGFRLQTERKMGIVHVCPVYERRRKVPLVRSQECLHERGRILMFVSVDG